MLPGNETQPLDAFAPSIPWLPGDGQTSYVVQALYFNLVDPPFNDPRVRQAFAAAIDREALVAVLNEFGLEGAVDILPATTFVHPYILGRDLYNQIGVPFDPQNARALMGEAGYPDGNGFPEITLFSNSSPENRVVLSFVRDALAQNLGVQIATDSTQDTQAYFDQLGSNPPEFYRLGWLTGPNELDPDILEDFHTGKEPENVSKFSNPDFDRLVDQARAAAADPPQRQQLYIQAEQILCGEQTAIIPLYHYTLVGSQ